MIGRTGGLSPPLGESACPDPRWGAGRALVLVGPCTFLGAQWVLTAGVAVPPPAVVIVPVPPPHVPEGSVPFTDDLDTPG